MGSKTARVMVAVVVFAICVALPSSGIAAGSKRGDAGASQVRPHKKKKARRCRWVHRRRHGRVRRVRVCRKPHRPPPPPEHPETPEHPEVPPEKPGGEEPGTGGGGGGGHLPPGKLPPIPEGYEIVDLIEEDNGFESSTAGFGPEHESDGSVSSSSANPIEGQKSLEATVHEYGKVGDFLEYEFQQGPLAASVTARAKIRVDSATGAARLVKVCSIAYLFETNQPIEPSACETFSVDPNQVSEIFLEQKTEGKKISRAYFQLTVENSGSVDVTLDDAHLFVVQKPGSGGGGGGGGGGSRCDLTKEPVPNGPPDPASSCDMNEKPKADSTYTPSPVNLPAQRPFIPLTDYTKIPTSSHIYEHFKAWVDENILEGHVDEENFSNDDAVIMFARTGDTRYIDGAIAREEADVKEAEADIAKGENPPIEGDSFLHVGRSIEELALTYDYGFNRLTQDQRERWKEYGDRVISNLWSPATAAWGSGAAGQGGWSAWAINDPGNNYFFSFIEGTQMWALATQNMAWIHFLQEWKFPLISDYYAALGPGGGSREGTGYGSSQRELWMNERMWRDSTGESLPVIEQHARESIDYWINATVPTMGHGGQNPGEEDLDLFAPAGDLSRDSIPHVYDYQVNLVREAAMDAPNTRLANNALWWIRENKGVPETMVSRFNLRDALLRPEGTPVAPTALSYRSPAVGELFARSAWQEDATWLQFIAGPYDQSHAHEEQGAFTFYRNNWLAVTSNIWSRSGLQGGGGGGNVRVGDLHAGVSNVIRFEKPGPVGGQPTVIRQTNPSTSTMEVETLAGGLLKAHANLTPAYANNASEVKSWKRDLEFQENHLHVHDKCEVGANVTPVFQVNVPVEPKKEGAGKVKAGKLELNFNPAYTVKLIDMTSFNVPPILNEKGEVEDDGVEFNSGWRIDITNAAACEFDVDLTANP